ncbi:MAG: J domain-containing protein [Gammaproteobacteria bacterium]|nr:J domain-containing protein [Gammaproteobacteria bacterium]
MNFLQCYQLLDLEPGCTWAELQTAYRHLVQKWHPDRFEAHPDQHHLAAQRILELNEAFEMLSRHHTVYGHLPGEPVPVPVQRSVATEAKRSRSPRTAIPAPPVDAVGKTPRWLLVIAMAVLGAALYLAITDKPRVEPSTPDTLAMPEETAGELESAVTETDTTDTLETTAAPAAAPAPAPSAATPALPAAFFTRGDTPGKVFEVEGVPTRTVGDVWFYGKSEVRFNKGVVVSWKESPDRPLKVLGSSTAAAAATAH